MKPINIDFDLLMTLESEKVIYSISSLSFMLKLIQFFKKNISLGFFQYFVKKNSFGIT